MRRWLLIFTLLLLLIALPTTAQTNTASVRKMFTVEPLDGFIAGYVRGFNWSPDGNFVALRFGTNDNGLFVPAYWQVYQVKTGTLIYQGAEFINWYADSRRMILRDYVDEQPYIVDIYTRTVIARLEGADAILSDDPIERFIINLDNDGTLRIYDAASGRLRLTLENVSEPPVFSPDRTRMAVNIEDTEVAVYETAQLTHQYNLPGYELDRTFWGSDSDWSPDSKRLLVILSASFNENFGSRHIWTLGEGLSQPIYNITNSMMWSADGTRIAGVSDYTKIRFYDATTGALLETVRGIPDGGPLELLHWNNDNLVLRAGNYYVGSVHFQIWDFARDAITFDQYVDYYNYRVTDDELIIHELLPGKTIRVNLATGEVIDITEPTAPGSGSFISPDWVWFIRPIFSDDSTPIYVYHLDPQELITILEHREGMVEVSWSPDSGHFISYADHGIIVWEIITDSVG